MTMPSQDLERIIELVANLGPSAMTCFVATTSEWCQVGSVHAESSGTTIWLALELVTSVVADCFLMNNTFNYKSTTVRCNLKL